jgi:hypothetical protein
MIPVVSTIAPAQKIWYQSKTWIVSGATVAVDQLVSAAMTPDVVTKYSVKNWPKQSRACGCLYFHPPSAGNA